MVQLGDGVSAIDNESINFSWVMNNGINESKSCSKPYYGGSALPLKKLVKLIIEIVLKRIILST